jgi:hypothetical protein
MPGARLAERENDGGRDFGVSWLTKRLARRHNQMWYADQATTIDGSGQRQSYRGKLGDAS